MTYILRLTPQGRPRRRRSSRPSPRRAVATQGETVEIRATLRSHGPATKRVAEFFLDGVQEGPEDRSTCPPTARPRSGSRPPSSIRPSRCTRARSGSAALPTRWSSTTSRFFTFKVQPALKVLVVSDLADRRRVRRRCARPRPGTLAPGTPRPFQVERIRTARVHARGQELLKDATCVFLLNVAELEADPGAGSDGYVREGGGLVIGLGDRCLPEHYNGNRSSRSSLPATLGKKPGLESPRPPSARSTTATHPLFSRYPKRARRRARSGAGLSLLADHATPRRAHAS